MIVFNKIRYKNLLSTGNTWTEINLSHHSSTVIMGDNGAGKSTFLDALVFALFGVAFRGINKPQLVNTITNKNMMVELKFKVGTNTFNIRRGIKPAVFEIYKNRVLVPQPADVKDYQRMLEKTILKCNLKTFKQVVILGSASFTPFMQLTAADRRAVIEELLDLQIFTVMNTLTSERVKENKSLFKEIGDEQELILEKIQIHKEHLADLQKTNSKLIEHKQDLVKETMDKIEFHRLGSAELESKIETLSTTIDIDVLTEKLNKISSLRHKIDGQLAVMNQDVKFLKKHDQCPTCKQTIDEGFKASSISEKQASINKIETGLAKLIKEYNEINDDLQSQLDVRSKITELNMERFKLMNTISSLEQYAGQISKEIESMSLTEVGSVAFDMNRLEELKGEYKASEERQAEAQVMKQILAAASLLLKDGGIKAKIIKQFIPVINSLINKYLSCLDFFIQFELNESFEETLKSRFRDDFSYGSFSEGEKTRINLAILFAWRAVAEMRRSVHTNLLVFDEIFDSSLDVAGTDEFLKLILNLTKNTNTFIITHKTDQLVDKFSHSIKFSKTQNFSKAVVL